MSRLAALLTALFAAQMLDAAVVTAIEGRDLVVTAPGYRLRVNRDACALDLELRDGQGRWRRVSRRHGQPEFAILRGGQVASSAGAQARVRHERRGEAVAIGLTTVLAADRPVIARLDLLCLDRGILIRYALDGAPADAVTWPLPRLLLAEELFDAYAFWDGDDRLHAGRIAPLGDRDRYMGVSPWGRAGDVAGRLSARHPAVIARGEKSGVALGAVLLPGKTNQSVCHSFVQRYRPGHLYFYPALTRAAAAKHGAWGWLAPFPTADAAAAAKVEQLLAEGRTLMAGFKPIAPEPDPVWTQTLPDFPAALRRPKPVEDIRQAAVFTVHETIGSAYGLGLARKVGSDVLVRAWFKWHNAADWPRSAPLIPQAHALGALWGGGITCSALYHGENGLTEEQVLDMATRGPDGRLVDAWGEKGTRHGTLSNPRYLDYLFRWCRQQIDLGADYLFMDEINAALQANEGFDDHSIRDFRTWLIRQRGWKPDDPRWTHQLKVDLADKAVCPDGTMGSFHYRAYLKALGLVAKPHSAENPLHQEWHRFRRERDDRAWKTLTDRIRAYAKSKGRRILISANGLARYVDLQVLGVWGDWRVKDGRIDLSDSQIQTWASTVASGWALAGRRVPVVFFHDWGFGGFPWMKVSPADRRLWMRVRGAEIYAAGGFFAFPVHGPFGQDSRRDGTLAEIARQTAFYQRHRDLYLKARVVGFEPLPTDAADLSLVLWRRDDPPALLLHVINRQARDGQPVRRTDLSVTVPVDRMPRAIRVVSPDWPGEREGSAAIERDGVIVTLPALEAYAVAILDYDKLPDVSLAARRIVPSRRWARPDPSEFVVRPDGTVADAWSLNGYLQGKLHTHLRNPPTFLVNLPKGGELQVHVQAVATQGARLECLLDGKLLKAIDLPDRDGRNDGSAREYDATYTFPLPAGRHRVAVRNVGADWATVGWYAFGGGATR